MSKEFADFTIEQDFSDIKPMEGGEFPLVPPGEYIVDVTEMEQKPSSTNNPMLVVTFTVAEAESQLTDEAQAFAGQKLWGNYSLLQQSLGRLKQLMVACRANLTQFRASEIMGSRLKVTVIHRQGEPKPDINGNLQAAKTFANVSNEQPLDDEPAQQAAPTPPVAKGATNGKATNGKAATTARRA